MRKLQRLTDPKTGEVMYVISDGPVRLEMGEDEFRRYSMLKASDLPYVRIRTPKAPTRRRSKPALRGLIRVADLFGLHTRKQIKAMAGDFQAEIRRLRKERRPMAARWNAVLAWIYAIYFVLRAPVDKLLSVVRKSMLG